MDIELPKVRIPKEEQDAHSKRLMKVCDLWDNEFSDEQIKRARRAYYGAVSYVDDCVGRILDTLKQCRLDDNTIVIFSGDHGDMLGERGLWYVCQDLPERLTAYLEQVQDELLRGFSPGPTTHPPPSEFPAPSRVAKCVYA